MLASVAIVIRISTATLERGNNLGGRNACLVDAARNIITVITKLMTKHYETHQATYSDLGAALEFPDRNVTK